jgi:hypothetical protein
MYLTISTLQKRIKNLTLTVREFNKRTVITLLYLLSYFLYNNNSSLFDEFNTTFFCSTSPLKAPNRLKPLKLA